MDRPGCRRRARRASGRDAAHARRPPPVDPGPGRRPGRDHLRDLARSVAAFHAAACRGPDVTAEGSRDALGGRWAANIEQMRTPGTVLAPEMVDAVDRLAARFLAGRGPLFADRCADGRIVDGHGDLIADDIFCLDDGPRVLDCLEFDDRLRYVDGLDDVAFLAMDLERLGRPDLADGWLDDYVEYSGDPAPAALRHHYVAYRAFVRAKVACLRHAAGRRRPRRRTRRSTPTSRLRHLEAGAVRLRSSAGCPAPARPPSAGRWPTGSAPCCSPATGSARSSPACPPTQPAPAAYGEGLYTTERTDALYAQLLHRAGELLVRGESVVLDASWTHARHRAAADELAAAHPQRPGPSGVPRLCRSRRRTHRRPRPHRLGRDGRHRACDGRRGRPVALRGDRVHLGRARRFAAPGGAGMAGGAARGGDDERDTGDDDDPGDRGPRRRRRPRRPPVLDGLSFTVPAGQVTACSDRAAAARPRSCGASSGCSGSTGVRSGCSACPPARRPCAAASATSPRPRPSTATSRPGTTSATSPPSTASPGRRRPDTGRGRPRRPVDPEGGHAVGRRAGAGLPGVRPARRTGAARPRRADRRAGPRAAPGPVGALPRPRRRRHDAVRLQPRHGRGRPLRPVAAAARRAPGRRRRARRHPEPPPAPTTSRRRSCA